jgi:PKD repeat protein
LLAVFAAGAAWLLLAQLASAATNRSPPTISDDGSPAVGETLTASGGVWSASPSTTSFQWLRCDANGANCLPIGGAVGTTYTLAPTDQGHTIRVRETATFAHGGPGSARSQPTAIVAPPGDAAPTAQGISVSPPAPNVGQPATFTGFGTDADPGDSITAYNWSFDGVTNGSTARTVRHAFTTTGVHTVQLRVTDSHGATSGALTRTVTVPNHAPVAGFLMEPLPPLVGDPVTFASTTTDRDGNVVGLDWDFGDASPVAHGDSVTHAYSTPGRKTVTLTARDAGGARSTMVRTVTVEAGELMRPFPIVRLAGRVTPRGARIVLLEVRSAPRGAQVEVRCVGRRCPYKRATKRATGRRLRVRGVQRWLPSGTLIAVRVSQRGKIGKYTRFRIRGGKVPARKDRCLIPPYTSPKLCPED